MRTRAEITPKVGVAHKILRTLTCAVTQPKHPPTVNPGSAPDDDDQNCLPWHLQQLFIMVDTF